MSIHNSNLTEIHGSRLHDDSNVSFRRNIRKTEPGIKHNNALVVKKCPVGRPITILPLRF